MDYQASQQPGKGVTSRIVAVYSLFGLAWIYGSDTVLGWLVQDSALMVEIAVIKGSLFILSTSALLYILINRFAKQLAASEVRYSTILNTVMDGFWLVNEQGRLLKVNEAYCRMSGYSELELLSMSIADLEVNETADDVTAHNQKIKINGEDRFVTRHRRKNGTTFDVEVSVKCLPAYNGLFVGFQRDISERKLVEESLRLTKFSIDRSSDGFFWITSDARIVDVNEAACLSLGYSREELLQLTVADINPFYNADVWEQHFVYLRQHGSLKFETVHTTKDGVQFPVEIVANYITFDGGECNCAIVRNITERKKAEQILQYERNLSMDILNAQPAGIYRIRVFAPETWENDAWLLSCKNSPYLIELASEPFCKILGTTKEALESNPGIIIDLIHPDDREGFAKINEEAAISLEEFMWEGRLLIDGVIRWAHFQSLPRPLENGDVLWTGALIDITDRIKAEEEQNILESQLQHTQKLESLGVLSGGIAHDFNNILAIIMGNCSLAKMDDENAGQYIPEIEKASERAAELCRQMLAYAGKAQFVQTSVNFQTLVGEMVNMLQKTTPQNAEIKLDCSSEISMIQGDSSQLNQVVMNLIINASEAIGKEQGEIRVLLAETTIHNGQPEKDYNGKAIPAGSYVCLEVTDNGCGMDEETKWRIFEPFYTTKFAGRGLGMSAVLGIIGSHKGALQLQSQLGQGSTFKVYLPAQKNNSVQDRSVQHITESEWCGHGTVLLAEDEDQIRSIVKTYLEMFGFTVVEAVNGKEALDLFQKYASDISLVMTDMDMPVMDGYALFHALKQIKPTLPIIISSGFGEADVTARIDSNKIAGLISKPYTPEKLRDTLKSIQLD